MGILTWEMTKFKLGPEIWQRAHRKDLEKEHSRQGEQPVKILWCIKGKETAIVAAV